MRPIGPGTLTLLGWRGTLWRGDAPLPGADALLRTLRRREAPLLVITNDTAQGPAGHAADAAREGLALEASDFLTASAMAITRIKVRYPGAPVLVVGTESLEEECREAGIEPPGRLPGEPVVLLGRSPRIDSERVFEAVEQVRHGAPFFATHLDRTHPTATGAEPDCGSLVAFFEAATGRLPAVFGKPDSRVVDLALGLAGFCSRREALVIGFDGSGDGPSGGGFRDRDRRGPGSRPKSDGQGPGHPGRPHRRRRGVPVVARRPLCYPPTAKLKLP